MVINKHRFAEERKKVNMAYSCHRKRARASSGIAAFPGTTGTSGIKVLLVGHPMTAIPVLDRRDCSGIAMEYIVIVSGASTAPESMQVPE